RSSGPSLLGCVDPAGQEAEGRDHFHGLSRHEIEALICHRVAQRGLSCPEPGAWCRWMLLPVSVLRSSTTWRYGLLGKSAFPIKVVSVERKPRPELGALTGLIMACTSLSLAITKLVPELKRKGRCVKARRRRGDGDPCSYVGFASPGRPTLTHRRAGGGSFPRRRVAP